MRTKTTKPKYPGLIAEMGRHGQTQETLGKVMGLSRTQIGFKLRGQYEWKISEIEFLCKYYKKNYNELFK